MKTPQEALAAARRMAASYPEARTEVPTPPTAEEARRVSMGQLMKWAIIEPDEAEVYSTRRFGGPITLVKRGLIRLLRQYLLQMSAQQSRFNAHAAAQLIALDDRVRELERVARESGRQ